MGFPRAKHGTKQRQPLPVSLTSSRIAPYTFKNDQTEPGADVYRNNLGAKDSRKWGKLQRGIQISIALRIRIRGGT